MNNGPQILLNSPSTIPFVSLLVANHLRLTFEQLWQFINSFNDLYSASYRRLFIGSPDYSSDNAADDSDSDNFMIMMIAMIANDNNNEEYVNVAGQE